MIVFESDHRGWNGKEMINLLPLYIILWVHIRWVFIWISHSPLSPSPIGNGRYEGISQSHLHHLLTPLPGWVVIDGLLVGGNPEGLSSRARQLRPLNFTLRYLSGLLYLSLSLSTSIQIQDQGREKGYSPSPLHHLYPTSPRVRPNCRP